MGGVADEQDVVASSCLGGGKWGRHDSTLSLATKGPSKYHRHYHLNRITMHPKGHSQALEPGKSITPTHPR